MKKRILIGLFWVSGMMGTAHANCYCQQGKIHGSRCVAPAGSNNSIVVIGQAICQATSRPSYYNTPHISSIDYRERCETTKDGGQACSMYVDDWISFTNFSDKSGKLVFQRFYYQDRRGLLKSESAFNGEHNRHGKTIHYYENGQPKFVMNYVNGQAQGDERQYHQNGKLKGIIYYVDDVFHGTFKFFDENEALIRTETFYKGYKTHSQEYQNGKKHGQEAFYKTNKKGKTKITKKVMWHDGEPSS